MQCGCSLFSSTTQSSLPGLEHVWNFSLAGWLEWGEVLLGYEHEQHESIGFGGGNQDGWVDGWMD